MRALPSHESRGALPPPQRPRRTKAFALVHDVAVLHCVCVCVSVMHTKSVCVVMRRKCGCVENDHRRLERTTTGAPTMIVLLSPAKALDLEQPGGCFSSLEPSFPVFGAQAELLVSELQKLSQVQLKGLLGVSDDLAK